MPFQLKDADVFLGPEEIAWLLHMERLSNIEAHASVEHPGAALISLLPLAARENGYGTMKQSSLETGCLAEQAKADGALRALRRVGMLSSR